MRAEPPHYPALRWLLHTGKTFPSSLSPPRFSKSSDGSPRLSRRISLPIIDLCLYTNFQFLDVHYDANLGFCRSASFNTTPGRVEPRYPAADLLNDGYFDLEPSPPPSGRCPMELLDQCREKPCLLAHLRFRHLGGLGAAGVAVFVPNLTTRRNASAVQKQALADVAISRADRERDGGFRVAPYARRNWRSRSCFVNSRAVGLPCGQWW